MNIFSWNNDFHLDQFFPKIFNRSVTCWIFIFLALLSFFIFFAFFALFSLLSFSLLAIIESFLQFFKFFSHNNINILSYFIPGFISFLISYDVWIVIQLMWTQRLHYFSERFGSTS